MGRIVDIAEVLMELGLGSSATDTERRVAVSCLRRAESAVVSYLGYDPVSTERTEYYPRADLSMNSGATIWEADDTTAYQRRVVEGASSELQLQHLPIRGAVELWIDYDGRFGRKSGGFASDTEKTEGEDFWATYDKYDDDGNQVCTDGILRSIGLWPIEPGSIKVTYTAGYTPNELKGDDSLLNAMSIWEAVLLEAVGRALASFSKMKNTTRGFTSGPLSSESLGAYSYSVDTSRVSATSKASLCQNSMSLLEPFVNYGIMLGG